MKNVFIKDSPIIKEIKLNKGVLETFKKGAMEKTMFINSFKAEISTESRKVEALKKQLDDLKYEKKELQDLIIKGTSGLTGKLIESQKNILEVEEKVKQSEEALKVVEDLKSQHAYNLEESLYRNFIDNGALLKEHKNNAEALQLKLYSLLYQAFEVEMELMKLSNEYTNTVDGEFQNYAPYRSFAGTFPYVYFINEAKQNFPSNCNHINNYNPEYLYSFVDKLNASKNDKSITLYK
ncbi:hypothetical protein [Clostridium perfringens]